MATTDDLLRDIDRQAPEDYVRMIHGDLLDVADILTELAKQTSSRALLKSIIVQAMAYGCFAGARAQALTDVNPLSVLSYSDIRWRKW